MTGTGEGSGLVARDVTVRFGGVTALRSVSLAAPVGGVTGLVGPNGAGKTTFFDVCCGFRRPAGGRVDLAGEDVTAASVATRARKGLGRTFQRLQLFGSMTVRENVALGGESIRIGVGPLSQLGVLGRAARRRRSGEEEEVDAILHRTGLSEVAGEVAGELPLGTARIVELARALARHPKLLLLDEPSSGLDVAEREAFCALVSSLVDEEGIGVLLVEHDMDVVLRLCRDIYVLDFGELLFQGTPTELRRSPEVRAAYLGQSVEAGS